MLCNTLQLEDWYQNYNDQGYIEARFIHYGSIDGIDRKIPGRPALMKVVHPAMIPGYVLGIQSAVMVVRTLSCYWMYRIQWDKGIDLKL
jgi:hypothetical protein